MTITAEFTVEPFEPGRPGPHVDAAIHAARSVEGITVEVGPFGTAVSGPTALALSALHGAVTAALAAGASRVSVQVDATSAAGFGDGAPEQPPPDGGETQPSRDPR